MSDNELLILIAIVFLFCGGLMFVLFFSIFKDLVTGIFNYDIFKMFNKAMLVNDCSHLELTGNFTSHLVIPSGNSKLELVLGKSEYEIIKEFLENEND